MAEPNTLGILMAASGLGALAGAFSLAKRKSVLRLGKRIVVCSGLFGVGLIAFGWSTHLWLSLLIMPVMGFSMMQHMASSNTILQTIVDDQKRGRSDGFLLHGISRHVSVRKSACWNAGGADRDAVDARAERPLVLGREPVVLGKAEEIRRILRPVYVQLGILPQAALGVQQASTLQSPERPKRLSLTTIFGAYFGRTRNM
jgi:hypothetical protein